MQRTKLVAVLGVVLSAAAIVAGGAARGTAASAFDEHWLKASAEGDMYEIAVGNKVLQKGASYSCGVGRMLVDDHTKALADTKALARKLGVKLPTRANPLQRALLVQLSRASGFTFQQMLASLGVADHQLDIAEANEAAKKASDARVRAAARKELPVLKKHLGAFIDLQKTTLTSGGTPTTTTTTPTATTPGSTTTTPAAATGCTQ
jgi:putative membrane protein